ncbi:MAG: sugar phosphate isomerase/epimerase [Propionibacterium sp.]|nr:sugar phosphate isomerase/epimerase [Propionibacterium sp.]
MTLSTTSVYPETSASAFELAAQLGFDGVELMVGVDPLTIDVDAIKKLSEYHGVPVLSVHAPVLLITPNTWGTDPWEKLDNTAAAARKLGASVVVVHPPFRWQREYGAQFESGIRRLNQTSGVTFAVENMFPWRSVAGNFQMYLPSWDPSDLDYDHLTLDLSHASTAQQHSLDLLHRWGDRLAHVHLTDGRGNFKDEHFLPGEGDQDAWEVVEELGAAGFAGHIVLEVSTRRARSRHERSELLEDALAGIRKFYAQGQARR